MKRKDNSNFPRRRMKFLALAGILIAGSLMSEAHAEKSDSAIKTLKAMSDYVTAQNTLSVTFDSDIEVITDDLQKLQFTSSGQVQVARPDKLRVSRTGGYSDVELVFDGKTLTINNKNKNVFAQFESAGSVEQVVDVLRDKYSVAAPGADLLLPHSFENLMADVIDAKDIGRGVIDDVECEHLAFRTQDTDWQIWVELGSRPIPHKYIITSKGVTGAPQYTLRIKDWKTNVSADAFTFKAPQGASQIKVEALDDIDEVPHGTNKVGEKK